MRKIAIWGLGNEWKMVRPIIETEEILLSISDDKIVAYTDINKKNGKEYSEKFVSIDTVGAMDIDLILVPRGAKTSIEVVMRMLNYKFETMTFMQYIKSKVEIAPQSLSFGERIINDAYLFKYNTGINARIICEIGANYGQDANMLKMFFGIRGSNVYVFEPHPQLYKYIREKYDFNCYDYAVGDIDGKADFYLSDFDKYNSGSSTCVPYEFTKDLQKIKVNQIKMKSFLDEHKEIEEIDFLKVDVEGLDYDVLVGFEEYIHKVKCIQTEAEQYSMAFGHHTFSDIAQFLLSNNFELVNYQNHGGMQSDSLWIRNDLMIRKWR